MSNDKSVVHVGNVLLTKENDQYTGVEIIFTKNVLNKLGATSILDTLRSAMNSAGWTTNTVMRVEDAQTDQQTDKARDLVAQSLEAEGADAEDADVERA